MSARPLLDDLSPPPVRRLGKYEIVGVLGQGAMGIVYDAFDPHINRRVAVKAIRAPLLAGPAQALTLAARFRTEARAAGRLSHPNIVSIYEYGEASDDRFIAMEYVHGVSLLELTAHGRRLPLDDVASVMTQLLDALECAHAQGVWHRDIKPANLLITGDGRLKVTDFGIARIESSDLTLPSSVLGSSGYMAPERYTGEAPDCRVDIFSCGVLMYELLTGSQPYRGSNSEVMYQVLNGEPPAPSTLRIVRPPPQRLDAVVARATARDRDARYASAAEMREALRNAVGGPIPPTLATVAMPDARATATDAPAERVVRGATVLDASLMDALTTLLVQQLGPVARIVVRDAARRSPSAKAAIARIAAEALDATDRDAFIRRARRLLAAHMPAPTAPPVSALPVLGTTPMTAPVAEAARQVLAEHVGPLAGVIVRRAAAAATSREQFFAALADDAGEDVDRAQLLKQLWRIA
ncbi:MAG: serine/threonine-protein kinase [Burkholderiales bacterium]